MSYADRGRLRYVAPANDYGRCRRGSDTDGILSQTVPYAGVMWASIPSGRGRCSCLLIALIPLDKYNPKPSLHFFREWEQCLTPLSLLAMANMSYGDFLRPRR